MTKINIVRRGSAMFARAWGAASAKKQIPDPVTRAYLEAVMYPWDPMQELRRTVAIGGIVTWLTISSLSLIVAWQEAPPRLL